MTNCTDCSVPPVRIFASNNESPLRSNAAEAQAPERIEGVPFRPATLDIQAPNQTQNPVTEARAVSGPQLEPATQPYQANGQAAVQQRIGSNIDIQV